MMSGIKPKVKISCPARLHLTLVAMHNNGYRINGGIGFCIERPRIYFEIFKSNTFTIIDNRSFPLTTIEVLKLKSIIDDTISSRSFTANIQVNISGELNGHSGFGSGTIIKLACLEALFILNEAAYTEKDLLKVSRRGGTSGIGINTYFSGGYVWDIGRRSQGDELVPSSFVSGSYDLPLVLKSGKMPSWKFGICIPKFQCTLIGASEELFFKENTPISDKSVYEILYHVTYGLVAGIVEKDLSAFSTALRHIQSTEWKLKERAIYSSLHDFEHTLYSAGVDAIAMSSIGPAIFFVAKNVQDVIDKIKAKNVCEWDLYETSPDNKGRIISVNNA